MLSDSKPTIPKALPDEGDLVDGKYRIERVIGEGGMGRVYAAHHEMLDQRVAIKLLFAEVAERPNVVERFLREAKAAAKLKSDHVARVMDAGTAESGLPFIVMECLEGADLMELVKLNGPMPEGEVVDIMLQALEAVAHAHAAEIVHRDLKPSNIFLALSPDGTSIVKVLDFGIAKSIASTATEVATLTGQNIMGSPAYMSPEQIRNARTVDVRSDLWSLGVVMYELITGKLPFAGEGIGELLAAVLEQPPIPARARKPDVSEALEKIMMRALKRSRDLRYPSAAEFARDLAPHASPRWAPLADRVEGILANAPRSLVSTSGAITAVQVRAAADGARGSDEVSTIEFATTPILTPGAETETLDARATDSAHGGAATNVIAVAPRSRRWLLAVAAAGALVVLAGAIVAVRLRPTQTASASPATSASSMESFTRLPADAPATSGVTTTAVAPRAFDVPPESRGEPPPARTPAASATGATGGAASASAPPGAGKGMIGVKPGTPGSRPAPRPPDKPVRPKVLHSRE